MQKPRKLVPVADPARRIDVHFSIRYAECDLADKNIESAPVLEAYLSTHFVRHPETGGVLNIHLFEDDDKHCFVGSLIGTLERDQAGISSTASIGLCSYALHRNEQGAPCYVSTGMTHVPIVDVLREVKERGAYDHTHDLVMRTTVVGGLAPVKKGVVEVRIERVELGPALRATPLMQSPLGNALEAALQVTTSYIEACMAVESAIPDTLKHTERIRAPMDLSEAGVELTQGNFLPVAAWAHVQTPRANAEFFENAYQCIMARRNLTHAAWHDFDDHEKARTLGLMLGFGIQTFDYIGDAVETGNRRVGRAITNLHVGHDSFFNLWKCLCGDCEDGSKANCATLKALLATDVSKYPHLAELQALGRQYYPFMCLMVVHGAKIGDSDEAYGAHMCTFLIPKTTAHEMLARTKEGAAMLEQMQAPTVRPQGVFGTLGANIPTTGTRKLPVLRAEGTGVIDSIGYTDPILEQRRHMAMNFKAAEHVGKTEIPSEEGAPSTFYKSHLMGLCETFSEEHGIPRASFVFVQTNGKSVTRGAEYVDVMNASSNVGILPHPPMPSAVSTIIKEAISLRPPPRDLILDTSKPMLGKPVDAHLDRFVKGVKALRRPAPSKPPANTVDRFVRPHHYNAAVIDAMLRDATYTADRLYDAEVVLERITNDVYLYRIRHFVK